MSRKSLSALFIAAVSLAAAVAFWRSGRLEDLAVPTDAIVVCGRPYPIGTRVVRWDEPAGFNAYVETRFSDPQYTLPSNPAMGCDTPQRHGPRACLMTAEPGAGLTPDDELPILRRYVDLIVIHYDAAGTSRRCFETLHNVRGLSAHFLIDLDGTVYQTLDVRERARHAGLVNDRSVGIELANLGAYDRLEVLRNVYDEVYAGGDSAPTEPRASIPPFATVSGFIQGRYLHQIEFTDTQYASLARLIVALTLALPAIQPDFPRNDSGVVTADALTSDELDDFAGVVGHYHVADYKIDPGPAFDWDRLLFDMRQFAAVDAVGPTS